MTTRTYISKFNAIVRDSDINIGINPVADLTYGATNTRLLVYFDHSKLKEMVDEKIFADTSKLKHTLHITNAGNLDFTQMHCGELSDISDVTKIRASSFNLLFFLIPSCFDGGKGFDYETNFFNQGYYGKGCGITINQDSSKLVSRDGCTWYQRQTGNYWEEEGIYTTDRLSKEYDKFSSGGSNVIIARQHFDVGVEDINVDITETVNKFLSQELDNYGIGIAFTPDLENMETPLENYVGFLTHKTNTFFEPYVETTYDDYISDDRANFALDKDNKLYLYANVGGQLENLDELPTCEVDGTKYEVKQFSKGVYYIDIKLPRSQFKAPTMLYDTWDNIIYHGTKLEAVELDFTTKSNSIFFNVGSTIEDNQKFTPCLYGINNAEKIKRGDIRKLVIKPKVNYTKNTSALVDEMYWRLYIKDGTREIDVIDWEHVNKTFLENYVLVDTSMLIPQRYYVDVKFKYNMEMIIHHNTLSFDITNDLNNKYN